MDMGNMGLQKTPGEGGGEVEVVCSNLEFNSIPQPPFFHGFGYVECRNGYGDMGWQKSRGMGEGLEGGGGPAII